MRVLVLGAYGLVGGEIVRRLRREATSIIGLGRDAEQARRAGPDLDWIIADLAHLTTPDDWAGRLDGVDAVVNASGALQDGARDNLARAQCEAIRALIAACEAASVRRYIQISAPGAHANAPTAFLRTKGLADDALRASTLEWIIFKPGLVVAANAYGGTSLLRQLAGVPIVQPLVLADRKVQTVAAGDVAAAVALALSPGAPLRQDFDLVEDEPRTLRDTVAMFRAWLGFPPARCVIELPTWMGSAIAKAADIAGWLGWRSPLRTTALRVIEDDVVADPSAWRRQTGQSLMPLGEALSLSPASAQERTYARAQLLFPIAIVTLALFWLASGVIGVARSAEAALLLEETSLAPLAGACVSAFAAADMLIGASLLVRSWARPAVWAAMALSLAYLVAGTIFTPHLWLDPLGPFVKVLPAMALAAVVLALMQDR